MDREKVIGHLYDCLVASRLENMWVFVRKDIVGDALALLKEQEAVEPDVDSEGTCTCRNCGENVGWYPAGCKTPVRLGKFCSNCGHEVKWND